MRQFQGREGPKDAELPKVQKMTSLLVTFQSLESLQIQPHEMILKHVNKKSYDAKVCQNFKILN